MCVTSHWSDRSQNLNITLTLTGPNSYASAANSSGLVTRRTSDLSCLIICLVTTTAYFLPENRDAGNMLTRPIVV